ncbi:tyrosinase [Rhizoctonia solani]|uniref:Tyrosinase n=1 Tax=Rhizoctonia solani TaxID=456999 RepID=A0A8H8T2Q3_9AGAM|nr:tyrosinase [Rhizoctonia solani]QRW27746.1 tyrosinase [Rhizoctonia solani]
MKIATAFHLSALVAFVAAAEQAQTCSSLEVRREWRSFSRAERKAWIDSVNCLNKLPSNGKINPPIDTERLEFTYHIAPFNASGTYYDDLGLCGWEGSAIMKKPAQAASPLLPQPWRNSNLTAVSTFTPAEVQKLLAIADGNFTQFQGYLEATTGMHAAIHLRWEAGTEGSIYCPSGNPTFSASEPMFHLHHANVDRLWWLWQEKNSVNKYAFHGGSVQNRSSSDIYPNGQPPWLNKTDPVPSAGLWDVYTIEQTLDTRSWPWCYVYDQ